MSKIIGILKDISQLVIGDVVTENNTHVTIKDAVLLGISPKGSQLNISFIPLDLLTLEPVFGIKNLLKDPTQELQYTFNKKDVLQANIELNDNVIENYKKATAKQPSFMIPETTQELTPEDNIVKLF